MGRERRVREDLEVEVPSFFRCPISLDVMKSPVSLCTGVSYDRSSIQTWIESGHRTCPATMQILSTTDLVPNHNLRRLIDLWSSSSSSPSTIVFRPLSDDPAAVLRREDLTLEAAEMAAQALYPLLRTRREKHVFGNLDFRVLSSLSQVLKHGSLDSRIAAAGIIEAAAESGGVAVSGGSNILPELLRLVDEEDEEGNLAGISCVAALSSVREMRAKIFSGGAIAAATKLLGRRKAASAAAENAMKLLGTAASCREGRAAIFEDRDAVPAVIERMLKLSLEAKENAVMVLWVVCCVFHNKRGKEELARRDGLTKILLMMQSGCSTAAKQMGSDLIKLFRVSEKGFLGSYGSRNTHITPF